MQSLRPVCQPVVHTFSRVVYLRRCAQADDVSLQTVLLERTIPSGQLPDTRYPTS